MNIRKNTTVAKGYRLKPQTHKLIKKIQKQLKGSQEEVISEALKHYSLQINQRSNITIPIHENN